MDRNEAIVAIEDLRAAERVATFATFLQHTAPVLRSSFYAFHRVTRPLESLTRAAESLGRSGRTEALQETGASEVRRAARAFNDMQGRIRRLIEDRMQMVAAISHDLRTPITRLKL